MFVSGSQPTVSVVFIKESLIVSGQVAYNGFMGAFSQKTVEADESGETFHIIQSNPIHC